MFRIACESIGKRTAPRRIPWGAIIHSSTVWAGIFALVCHEYPLVIMLQFLPNYMRDILQFAPAKNGIISALPTACLFISKTLSSSLSTWLTVNTTWSKTKICKVNAVNSFSTIKTGFLHQFTIPSGNNASLTKESVWLTFRIQLPKKFTVNLHSQLAFTKRTISMSSARIFEAI